MAMPAFQDAMLPILKLTSDGKTYSVREFVEYIEKLFNMTEEEKQERIPSGIQRTIYNRVTWATSHMKKAGLIESREKRGSYGITEEGKRLLSENPQKINTRLLRGYATYRDFINVDTQESPPSLSTAIDDETKTPEEIMGMLSVQLSTQLASDILEEICNNTADFFEKLVVDLLLKMGYGGLDGSGEVTKKTGDGGIDGIIKQDELGLDMIYIQAKKWNKDSTISRPEIQKFAGALLGEGATKGVFITTAEFSKSAIDYAKSVPNTKIILIDGLTLARFMIKHDLGVSTNHTIRIKKIDSDYFDEQ
jgi:restriction system protein